MADLEHSGCPVSSGKGMPGDLDQRWSVEALQAYCKGQEEEKPDALTADARQAWKQSVRCIGRQYYRSLQVTDARGISNLDELYEGLCQHLEQACPEQRIRFWMTVFPAAQPGIPPVRIWNHQLYGYAGYRQPDGSVLGDPKNADFTDLLLRLGWQPPSDSGAFDMLPWLLQWGDAWKIYKVPPRLRREVVLRHPEHAWLEKMHLRWYTVPILSDMLFATRSAVYPSAPFNGWYMATEISARNLSDENRYNLLPQVAEGLGMSPTARGGLWRDHALLVLTEAVLHSFQSEGYSILDHHQASREFVRFCDREEKQGNEVHGDWTWLLPPLAGSSTPVFHRRFAPEVHLPNFFYAEKNDPASLLSAV